MDRSVYLQRLQLFCQSVHSQQPVDLAVLTSPVSVYYLTGFWTIPYERFMALVLDVRKGEAVLFVPALDAESALAAAALERIVPIQDTDNPADALKRVFSGNPRSIGIEKSGMNVKMYDLFREALGVPSADDIEPVLTALRSRKTEEEIVQVRTAAAITDQVLEASLGHIRVGMTELDLVAEIEYRIRMSGADRPAFTTTVLGGARSALPHGQSGTYRLKDNDFLIIDMGVTVNGYCSDITRTFLIGEGTDQQSKMYDIVREANRRGIESAEAGRLLSDVDHSARSYIESCGYGAYFNHRVGHGLGLEVHEEPSVHSANHRPLEQGLLFTVEPGIYVPDLGGVRIEDNVWIGPDGKAEVLTGFSRELMRLA